MARAYKCRGCGFQRGLKWTFRCPNCGGFYDILNTVSSETSDEPAVVEEDEIVSLDDVTAQNLERISSGIAGFDRVLGSDKHTSTDGIAATAGHVIEMFGSPGSGKSTLLLQALQGYTRQRYTALYVAAEEPPEQVKGRADRLKGKFNKKLLITRSRDLDAVLDAIEEAEPDIVAVDSVNVISVDEYATGSTAAIVVVARELVNLAKERGFGLILIVQITKSGDFSGPKALEHLIDTTLFLRGTTTSTLRTLECTAKNRYHQTPVFAYFNMTDSGLVETSPPAPEKEEEPEAEIEEKAPAPAPPLPAPKKPPLRPVQVYEDAPRAREKTTRLGDFNSISLALAVPCEVPDCRGTVGRACTSANGTREAGLHQSRIVKAGLKPKLAVVTPAQKTEPTAKKPPKKKPPAKKSAKRKKPTEQRPET